ncbi:MAG TPA: hypothetical protein PK283_07920, partial [Thiotrichales bacterium]|nr:hypothetical protein [Thiotrichales bacterium]
MNFRFKRLGIAFIFAALFVLAHFLIWSLFNQAYLLIEAPKVVNGFAYAGYQKGQSPLQRVFPSTAELANDLSLLKPLTNKVRIYDSLENTEVIPLAARLDM